MLQLHSSIPLIIRKYGVGVYGFDYYAYKVRQYHKILKLEEFSDISYYSAFVF